MFRQLRPYWCGPAALQALQLELQRGPQLTQAEWAELADTDSTGTGETGLKRALGLLAPFREVRRACRFSLAIVFDPWRDHWVVARRVAGLVLMLDPWDGAIECYPWSWFRWAYFDVPPRSYALIVAG